LLYGSDILSKNSAKLLFFFKKIEIFKIQNFDKISSFTISFFTFLAFVAFCFLFHLSKLVKKIWNFLCYFIARLRDFTNDFWKFLKVLNIDIQNFFFQNSTVYHLFFIFLLFFTFIFNFSCLYLSKNCKNFYVFFYFME